MANTDLREYTHYLSDLDYDLTRKIISEGLKARIYGRHNHDEDLAMYFKMQITSKEFQYLSFHFHIEPKNDKLRNTSRKFWNTLF